MTLLATISKDFEFSASHQLEGLPDDHPCSRVHGHNYTVRLSIVGVPDAVGFVVDYRRLAPLKQQLDSQWDHRHLNDVLPGVNPTAENMAGLLLEWACALLVGYSNVSRVGISISETPKTWATRWADLP